MRAATFLEGEWIGEGVVRGVFGRVLRRMRVSFAGVWSDEHLAVHLDEEVAYADGRGFRRRWAIGYLGLGAWKGADDSGGRLLVREDGDRIIMRFHRSAAIRSVTVGSLKLVLRWRGPKELHGRGVTRLFGVPIAWTRLTLSRP